MSPAALKTSEQVLEWLMERQMVVKGSRKDPETFATVQGFVLSEEMRERIGRTLVDLITKSSRKRKSDRVTLKDAFLAATIAALLQKTRKGLSQDQLTECANVIFALLPIDRLEQAGLADKRLRAFARDRSVVDQLQRMLLG
jgi:hypothetical protein